MNDEIFAMENRVRMLADDKARSEHENRERLNRNADEISDARRQLEDLKYLLSDKYVLCCKLRQFPTSRGNSAILSVKASRGQPFKATRFSFFLSISELLTSSLSS